MQTQNQTDTISETSSVLIEEDKPSQTQLNDDAKTPQPDRKEREEP